MPARERQTTFLRLLVELPAADSASRRTLREAVRSTLDPDADGQPWQIARLFPADPTALEDVAARFVTVSGLIESSTVYPVSKAAFDLARRLADATQFRVEPDLPTSVYDPRSLDRVAPGLPVARGAGPDRPPLPEATRKDWALKLIRAPEARKLKPPDDGLKDGKGCVVGHPDTGYTEHPELGGQMLDLTKDRDILEGDDEALDPLEQGIFGKGNPGHGTKTSSVIASRVSGEVTGVAPAASVMPIRTIVSVAQIFDGDVAKAIDYARRSGCHVISMSLGGFGFTGLRAAIQLAIADGLIVLAAAGNEVLGNRRVVAPANYEECIAVAATNALDRPWIGSCRGKEVDISAPGESVWVAQTSKAGRGRRYSVTQGSGTSFAVAHVAGVAALWVAFHGRDDLLERYGKPGIQGAFKTVFQETAREPQEWNERDFGPGIIDAEAVLTHPLPDAPARPQALLPSPRTDDVERLLSVVPELSRAEVLKRVRTMFGTTAKTDRRTVARFGAELAYLLAENPDLREEFIDQGLPRAAAAGRAPRSLLARSASAGFAVALKEDAP